jgi:hypothetical protein
MADELEAAAAVAAPARKPRRVLLVMISAPNAAWEPDTSLAPVHQRQNDMSADPAGGGLCLAAPGIVRSMDGTDSLDSSRQKKHAHQPNA